MDPSSPESFEDTLPLRELPTETSLGESAAWDLYSSASEDPRSYETSPASDEQLSWFRVQQTESRSSRGAPQQQGGPLAAPQRAPPAKAPSRKPLLALFALLVGAALLARGAPRVLGAPQLRLFSQQLPSLGAPQGDLERDLAAQMDNKDSLEDVKFAQDVKDALDELERILEREELT
ncbi:hypothetical protein, conserved [Eimeria tenella]|uniref:Uncharacterized protein n=1 Tax=Eimeria tenella TaxID=5802 RepID=U6KY63_EIMTE|nr:hypothetical protein, conserved [Eimeria tenella]CDJ41279.1 hypothetical protein, conserved [Eimeria tenella]|eukprot:XP_013232029.1 hypothetical protein, conserved [Eimeria tenella]